MISNKKTAKEVVRRMMECSAALDDSVRLVMDTCSEDEFKEFRKAIGEIMGGIYFNIYRPIFRQFPDLEPESFKPDQP